ncbi:hypothetical protein A9Q87_13440 [Flavobacteriales bacterium 34_180_T64]|nr:hypothetical protein A9Q87_13440 [Flavobacteriales bacterium 34_180_T64]
MNFAPFYEFFEEMFGMFDNDFSIIFQTLFTKGGYNDMGWILLGIPLVFLGLFYFLWKYPYHTKLHYWLYLGFIALIVGVVTFSSVNLTLANFLVHTNPLFVEFTEGLILFYAILNACLSILVSYIFSLGLRLKSKVQKHLPH